MSNTEIATENRENLRAEVKEKEGYKKTKLGWIPEEWEINPLGELIDIRSGNSPSSFKESFDGIEYIKVDDLNNCLKYQRFGKYKVDKIEGFAPKNSLIFPKRGAAILNNKVRISKNRLFMDSNLMAITPKHFIIDYEYLYYFLVNRKLYKIADTSTIPQINNKHINPLKVIIPPLPEQKVIATCLSTWDAAIAKLTKLIKKKQKLKKALMQQMLSGEKRLPGFYGEWEEKRIDDFASEYSRKNERDQDIEVLSCTKYDGLVPSLDYFGRQVFGDDLSKYKMVPKGYFAYATNHIEEGSLGYQDFNELGLVSPMYTVFKTDETIDDNYLFKVLKSHQLIHEYNRRMEGSIDRRGGLRWKNFKGIKINIPLKREQTAIAQVLNISDQEIQLLTTQRDHLKLQKKGLMQQLLTGKKRLSVNK